MLVDPATGCVVDNPPVFAKSVAEHSLEEAEGRIKELEYRLSKYEKFLSALNTLDLDVSRFASMISRAACSSCRSDVDNSVCDNLFWLDLLLEAYNEDKE